MLPWSLFAFQMKVRNVRKDFTEHPWIRAIGFFLLFNLPLYWISSGVRDRYLYMFLPFLYLLLIYWSYQNLLQQFRIIRTLISVLYLIIIGGLIYLFIREGLLFWMVIVSAVSILLFGLNMKKTGHPVFHAMLVMMILRFAYNHYVFPIRQQSQDNIEATRFAKEIAAITKDDEVQFYGKTSKLELKLPFRSPVSIDQIDRLPHQLSFYYSSTTRQVLNFTPEEPTAGYFITELPYSGQALYHFRMEGRDFTLVKK
jgi:hypothetical protein